LWDRRVHCAVRAASVTPIPISTNLQKCKITATMTVDGDTRRLCRPMTVRTSPADTSAEMKAIRVTDDVHVFRNSRLPHLA